MASQNQSKNIAKLLDEKSALMQELFFVDNQLSASQVEDTKTQVDKDYMEEDDHVCNFRKRKTKKTKFEQCKDKNTKALLETNFDRRKRDKVARAAKRTHRHDLRSVQETPFQGFEPINPVKFYNTCNSFIYKSDARVKKAAEIKAAAKKAVEKEEFNLWLYNDLQEVIELTAAAAKKAVEKADFNLWLYNHLQEVIELTADW